MQFVFEWLAQHEINVLPGSFLASRILANGTVLEVACGRDTFAVPVTLPAQSRVAGFGRNKNYSLPSTHSVFEATPSQALTLPENYSNGLIFEIVTNMFLSQSWLSHFLSFGIKSSQTHQVIPLSSPAVTIDWQARGLYLIKIKHL